MPYEKLPTYFVIRLISLYKKYQVKKDPSQNNKQRKPTQQQQKTPNKQNKQENKKPNKTRNNKKAQTNKKKPQFTS